MVHRGNAKEQAVERFASGSGLILYHKRVQIRRSPLWVFVPSVPL